MAVIIEGFIMPKSCKECPILDTHGCLEWYCPLAESSDYLERMGDGRMIGCPLAERPD